MPRVFFTFNAFEKELEFIRWTPHHLIVKSPPGSKRVGEWRMGRTLVNHWLKSGVLRIEGDVPDWALVV